MTDPQPLVSAAELRHRIAEMEAHRMAELLRRQAHAHAALDDFIHHFLRDHLDEHDLAEIRLRVRHAAEQGRMEVLAMRFPSRLCCDHGRAINNAEPGWPDTLPGKAREFYETWERTGKPLGYHLRASILEFPDDLPGDVGLFLNWEPRPGES